MFAYKLYIRVLRQPAMILCLRVPIFVNQLPAQDLQSFIIDCHKGLTTIRPMKLIRQFFITRCYRDFIVEHFVLNYTVIPTAK
jgi:hypothetical protein